MKGLNKIYRLGMGIMMIGVSSIGFAQSSLPAPGSGGGFQPGGGQSLPAPGSGGGFQPNNGFGPGGPGGPVGPWGSPWGGNGFNVNLSIGTPGIANNGVITVMGCGYDSRGVWRTIPLRVSYSWNGVQYNVTVLSAWNPWSDMWNRGIDMPAYNTSYYINGQTYNFYTPLSTGTYYFNL